MIFIAFILFLFASARDLPYTLLDVTTPPQNADALVILAGGLQRVNAAASLFPLVQPQWVILSAGAADVEDAQTMLINAGVPPERILPITTATTTYDEAELVLTLLAEYDIASAIIVTDAPHSARVRATYRCLRQDRDLDIDIQITASAPASIDAWYRYRATREYVISEWSKLVGYFLRYGVTCY